MSIIPTYDVTVILPQTDEEKNKGYPPQGIVYGVPEDELESFLKVLIFNAAKEFRVKERDLLSPSLPFGSKQLEGEDNAPN